MTKSKYVAGWLVFLTLMLTTCAFSAVIGFSQYFLHYTKLGVGMRLHNDAIALCFIGLTGSVFFYLFLCREANLISIDTVIKTISFKNIFTRRINSFSFSDLSGYIDGIQRTRRGNFKVLYIVQDKRCIKKISSAIYKNFDELLFSPASLEYLGFKKLSLKQRFQILFNKPIIS